MTYIDKGHLEERIDVIDVPVVAPLLSIDKATYGLPAVAMAERARDLDRRLDQLREVGRKKKLKLGLSADEHRILRTMNDLREEVVQLIGVSPAWYEVSGTVQLMVDRLGGHTLDLGTELDLNAIFGDPLPGLPKELSLQYHVNVSNEELPPDEMASDGLSFRTFWIRKNFTAKLNTTIDRATHHANLAESVHYEAIASLPQLAIVRAGWELVRRGVTQVGHATAQYQQRHFDSSGITPPHTHTINTNNNNNNNQPPLTLSHPPPDIGRGPQFTGLHREVQGAGAATGQQPPPNPYRG